MPRRRLCECGSRRLRPPSRRGGERHGSETGGASMIGAFLTWLEHSLGKGPSPDAQSWSEALLGSLNFWGLLEGTHLIMLMLFAGTIAVVDLRLLGVTFRKTRVSVVTDAILTQTVVGFIFVV